MNKNKIWAVVILVVVVLVVVGIVVVDRKVAKAPEVSGSAVPTGANIAGQTSSTVPVVQESYTGGSFSLNYPNSWTVSSTSFFSINTFGGKYQSGWMIPMGGAEIDVVTTTVYSSVKEIMTTELMSAVNLVKSTVTIDGVSCSKATYQHSYTPGVVAQNVSVYCLHGSELWKIYFAYRSGDPAAQAHASDFNGVLGSIKFLP